METVSGRTQIQPAKVSVVREIAFAAVLLDKEVFHER